jgi:dihydroxyacetone kinase-like predicted kinase
LGAVNSVKAKNVYILPNNSNIIMAAKQVKDMTDIGVYVIPTTNMPEGISAALMFSPDASPEENESNMTGAFKGISTAEVTHAVRNTKMNGFSVKSGDIIGISGKSIVAKSGKVIDTAVKTASKLCQDAEMLSLYYGEGVTEEDANQAVEEIQKKHPDLEIAAYYGGQPHYYYIMAAE